MGQRVRAMRGPMTGFAVIRDLDGGLRVANPRYGLRAFHAVTDYPRPFIVGAFFSRSTELSMKKVILVGFAILAVSTSGALAQTAKPKAAAGAATSNPGGPAPFIQPSAKDLELYKKNQRDSGIKKK